MKLRKWLLPLLAAVLLAALLVGCNGKDPPKEDKKEDEPITEKTLVLCDTSGEAQNYNIIYPGHYNENVLAMVKDLQAAVKEATGVTLKYSTDSSKLTVESPYEILFGKTTRSESVASLEKIEGIAYRIERAENKIVITASDDKMLQAALEQFKTMFKSSGGKLSVTVGLTVKTSEEKTFPLALADGTIPFRIVIPKTRANGNTTALYNAAQNLKILLEGNSNQTFEVCLDSEVEPEDGAYEICLGKTNRQISQDLYDQLENIFEYRIAIFDHRIAVGGKLDEQLVKGVEQLCSDLGAAFDGTYAGIPSLSADYGGVFATNPLLNALALPEDGVFQGFVDCGKDSYIIYYKNVKEKTAYDNYVAKLQANGATVKATYTLGDNSYTLLKHDVYTAYVSYLVSQQALRIYAGSPDDLDPPTTPVADAKKITPKLWSVELNYQADGGMSYVIQLSDGKFLVFDGGYTSDGGSLVKLLEENKPANHAKPIVAGWFISHLHGDHYGCLLSVSSGYVDRIEVEAFYHNFPYVSMGEQQHTNPDDARTTEAAMRRWKNAKLYRKLHSGECFYFSGASVTVLCTLEDVYPSNYGDGNDTSTVVRVEIAGQRIIFTGDANPSESAAMVKLGREVLKADIVQFAHHGYPGCSKTFYQMVDPEVVLWPMNILSVDGKTNVFQKWYNGALALEPNFWVASSDNNIKKVIVAGAGTECLILPYTPTGDKLVDINEIFEQKKAGS